MARCTTCDAKTDLYLCLRCGNELSKLIGDMPAMVEHLIDTVARQDRLDDAPLAVYGAKAVDVAEQLHAAIPARLRSSQGRVALPSTPWQYRPDAADLLHETRTMMVSWIRHLTESRGLDSPVLNTTLEIASWLLTNLPAIRMDEAAGALHWDFQSFHERIEQLIDHREPDVPYGQCDLPDVKVEMLRYIGPICPGFEPCEHLSCGAVRRVDLELITRTGRCDTLLFGPRGADKVNCLTCGTEYDASEQQLKKLDALADHLGTAVEVSSLLTNNIPDGTDEGGKRLTVLVTSDMIRRMASRTQQIIDYGLAPDGRSRLYKVSEVRAVLENRRDRKACA